MKSFIFKFYNPETCFDGHREFIGDDIPKYTFNNKTDQSHYPDEYVIVSIVQAYLQQEKLSLTRDYQVLYEPWKSGNKIVRPSDTNTSSFNRLIVDRVKQSTDTVFLIPFLYGYHHMVFVIDTKHKSALYMDPYGRDIRYQKLIDLKKLLTQAGLQVTALKTEQQYLGDDKGLDKDEINCGPISAYFLIQMTKWIEESRGDLFKKQPRALTKSIDEFIQKNNYSKFGKKTGLLQNIATHRLNQMNLHNNYLDTNNLINEVMLATESLITAVIKESTATLTKKETQNICNFYSILEKQKGKLSELSLNKLFIVMSLQLKTDRSLKGNANQVASLTQAMQIAQLYCFPTKSKKKLPVKPSSTQITTLFNYCGLPRKLQTASASLSVISKRQIERTKNKKTITSDKRDNRLPWWQPLSYKSLILSTFSVGIGLYAYSKYNRDNKNLSLPNYDNPQARKNKCTIL